MKTIGMSCIAVCFIVSAHAQSSPDFLNKHADDLKLKRFDDTTLLKLETPGSLLNGGNQLNFNLSQPNNATAPTGNNKIYSRMPVAGLSSKDKMPVAKLNGKNYTLLVKRVTVIDPLKKADVLMP